jgi:hypothetical protein
LSSKSILALFAILAVGAVAVAPAAAEEEGVATVAKGKKCKKSKGKKCKGKGKKKGKGTGQTPAGGPEMAVGDYYCGPNGNFQVQAGRRYTVNRGNQGSYVYDPATGHVDFVGGSYDFMYGIYASDTKTVDLYAADSSVVEIGTYGWSCDQ